MDRLNALTISNKYTKIMFVFAFILVAMLFIKTPKAYAAYDGSRLIDNAVFLDANTMNANQIQQFLVDTGAGLASRSFVLTCGAPNDTTTMQAYASVGAPCGQTVPASSIIYYAAQIYGVNPRVILATMQKEQSLTTAANPTDWQISQAMGYACPTTGSCSSSSNFFYQIDNGTWALRFHYERARGNLNWWFTSTSWTCGSSKPSYYVPNLYPGQNVTFIDPYSGAQYANVFIQNAATSAFYCYTPHVFNNHANSPHPNELSGSSSCYPSLPVSGSKGRCYTGSYNFVLWFERWFGPTNELITWDIVTQNAYTDSTKLISADLGNLKVNKRYYLTVTFKNTGNVTWEKLGSNPATLGTSSPRDRLNSPFCDTTWLGCNRPAVLNEYTVAPGQYGSYEFWIKTPSTTGNFEEIFAPLLEGKMWMDSRTISFPMYIPPINTWTPTLQYAYTDQTKTTPVDITNLAPGQRVFIGFTATNTGNTTWVNNGPNPTRVGTTSPRDRMSLFCDTSWLACNRPTTIKEASVTPGQTGTFEFWYKAPMTTGYVGYEQYSLMIEGYNWMNDPGMSFYTKVK